MELQRFFGYIRVACLALLSAVLLPGAIASPAQVITPAARGARPVPAKTTPRIGGPALPRAAATVKSFQFFGRAENLLPSHYWYLGKKHKAGSQGLGGDFTMVRFDAENKEWTKLKLGVTKEQHEANPKNENSIIYGQPVYAPADGEILACWRNAPDNPKPGVKDPRIGTQISGAGNFLWIKFSETQFGLFAHAKPGSIPSKFCPNNNTFKSFPNETLLPEGNYPKVKLGEMIMLVGNTGQSSGPHLHAHLVDEAPKPKAGGDEEFPDADESVGNMGGQIVPASYTPRAADAIPLPFHGVAFKSATIKDDSPNGWVRVNGKTIDSWPTLILPDYSKGLAEIARHGVPASNYQFVFDHVTKSGYYPSWVDGFEVNGKNYYNVIFRPADNVPRAARHGLTGEQYQTEYDDLKAKGLRLVHVDSYTDGASVRYAALFAKDGGPLVAAYHGIPADDHQKRFDERTKSGWRPKVISVVSLKGQRFYTALYEKAAVGNLEARSFLTPAEYQKEYDDNKAAGRQIVYLNAYEHSGGTRFTAIFSAPTKGSTKALHGISGSDYQKEWKAAVQAGFRTQAVAGYASGGQARIAAFWRK